MQILFWLSWPLLWMYAPLRRSVRCVVDMDGEFVVVKNRFGAGKWQLAGGGINSNESVEQAARRELYEELGINVDKVVTISEQITVPQFGLLMRYQFVYVQIPKQKLRRGSDISDFTIYNDDLPCAREVREGMRLLKSSLGNATINR